MSKDLKKEKEREKRRERILDAAERIIVKRGFESATMDEIAEEADLGKGTLYLYFKSKSWIYVAICERGSTLLNGQMARVLSKDLSGLGMIEELGRVYLGFIRENPQYYHAFNFYEGIEDKELLASSELGQRCDENTAEALTYVVRALQIGIQDGSIDNSVDPKHMAVLIWAGSKGILHMAFLKKEGHHYNALNEIDFSMESMISDFIQLITHGIKKKN